MTALIHARPNTAGIALALIAVFLTARGNPVWVDTAVVIGIYGLVALSAGLCFGQAGLLSMAQGIFAALGAYATAVLSTRFGVSPWVGLPLSVALPALVAYGLARIIMHLAPLATALATLALGSLIEIGLRNWDSVTGGFIGIAGIPPVTPTSGPVGTLALVCVIIVIVVYSYENLMRSSFGRALNVIRHDRLRAEADGVRTARLLSAAFALSAGIAGVAGWIYAHYITFLAPNSLDTHLSIAALLMAVVGGSRFILGPLLGTALFNVLIRLLPAQEVEGLFYGGALIVILLLAPEGLLGLLSRIRRRWGGSRPASPAAAAASKRLTA